MEISSNGVTVNIVCESKSIPFGKIPILFLHGFTGSAENWTFLFDKLDSKYFPIAIDLPGHGKTTVPNNLDYYSTEFYIETVNIVLNYFNITQAIFIGYSMGGRVALSFSLRNPEKVLALVLESTTAGIEKKAERISRVKIDSEIAYRILLDGIDSFVEFWLALPFFSSLKSLDKFNYSKLIEQKKKNSAIGLSNSLKGFSTGKMPSLWNQLNSLTIPTLLIAGNLDRKYVRINKEINQLLPNSELKIIADCGHNTHLENRKEFTILTNKFLNNLENHET